MKDNVKTINLFPMDKLIRRKRNISNRDHVGSPPTNPYLIKYLPDHLKPRR